MKWLCVFATLLVAVAAQEYYENYENYEPQPLMERSLQWHEEPMGPQRLRRDVTGTYPVGENGRLIGTLGNTPGGKLFGQAGYGHDIINDDRGRLTAEGYGTRVLGPNRDSTHYGGKLNWQGDNTHASLDASQRLGGRARVDAIAGLRWEPFRNAEVTAGGHYSHREGRPSDYGFDSQFKYRF